MSQIINNSKFILILVLIIFKINSKILILTHRFMPLKDRGQEGRISTWRLLIGALVVIVLLPCLYVLYMLYHSHVNS